MSARIRFRPSITEKTCVLFSAQRAHYRLLPLSEKKQLISGDKKTFRKKTILTQEIKKHFPSYVFILLVFFVALIIFYLNKPKVFPYFVALINFSRNLSDVFFYLGALINFSKNRFNVFFFLNVFLPPSLNRILFFSDLKQSGLM